MPSPYREALARATPQTANVSGTENPAAAVAGGSTPYRDALNRAQIPERTAERYQQLANIPAEDFEKALADPASKPTLARVTDFPQPNVMLAAGIGLPAKSL